MKPSISELKKTKKIYYIDMKPESAESSVYIISFESDPETYFKCESTLSTSFVGSGRLLADDDESLLHRDYKFTDEPTTSFAFADREPPSFLTFDDTGDSSAPAAAVNEPSSLSTLGDSFLPALSETSTNPRLSALVSEDYDFPDLDELN